VPPYFSPSCCVALDINMDNKQAANLLNKIADLISSVEDVADESTSKLSGLGMAQEAQQLRQYAQIYNSDRVNLLIVGAFNNGKSTLVNALLGVEAVQTGAVPTTAVFTHLRRGEQAIMVHPHRGSPYSLESEVYWDQYNLSSDIDWAEVDYLEITDEFEQLPEGITLIDTPGLAENRLRTALVLEYLPHANAVVVVLDAKQALSRAERNFIDLLGLGQLQNVFFAINRIDMLSSGELIRLKDWIQKRLRRYFTSANGEFSETLYRRRVFFTVAIEDDETVILNSGEQSSVTALREALMDWLAQHQQSTTPAELQPLIPMVADVLHHARQRMAYQQNALQQPLETLETQLAKSEARLQQMEQARVAIEQRIRNAGNVMKHRIYSDLVNYIQTMQATWETDVQHLDLEKLCNLNIFSAKFANAEQTEIAEVLSQELQRYTQRKLVKWAQQLPKTLQGNVSELLEDISYELRDFQVELDEIAGLMGQDSAVSTFRRQCRDAGLLELDETLYAEIFKNKTLLQMIQPMTDKVFADLSTNKTFMDVALATVQAIFDWGARQQRLIGFFSDIGSDFIQQIRFRREREERWGDKSLSRKLDEASGNMEPEKIEKLQRVVKVSLVENLRSPLFSQMRDAILTKKEAIFQQVEAEFDKIGAAIGKKLEEAIEEVRTTQRQLVDTRRSYQGSITESQEHHQALEQDLREHLDRICSASIGRTLSDCEIEQLSEQRSEFLTRPAPIPDEIFDLPASEISDTFVVPTLPPSISPEIINYRVRIALERVLGFEHLDKDVSELGSISAELSEMIGLDNVKQRVLELMDFQAEIQRRRDNGLNVGEPPSLHLVFTGNPGTGKTTVAEIVGKMYRRLGLLKSGHLISVGRSDLVGAYQGHTEKKVHEVVEKAADGVLFIDEAYTLVKNQVHGLEYGMVALEELMRYMEKYRGRFAVLVAGYPRQMRDFLRANPGLMSRFPPDNVIHFPDYKPEELQQILDRILTGDDYRLSPEARIEIDQIISKLYERRDAQFGNAREMRNLAQALVRRRATRIQRGQLPVDDPIRPEDIDEEYRVYITASPKLSHEVDTVLARINQMVGLSSVKDAVGRLVNRARISQRLNEPIRADTLHMLFRGAPGTGKTTVAKEFGNILKELGYLRQGHLVSVTRSDLVGEYIGHSEKKIRSELEQAKDGVLFIDEAYSLFMDGSANDFGRVVLNELTGYMDEHRDRLVVILAGYRDEIDTLLTANPGLRDRFRSPIDFPNYTQNELLQICRKMAKDDGYELTTAAEDRIASYLERHRKNDPERFGNARAVRMLLDEMKDRVADRIMKFADTITDEEDLRRLAKQLEEKDVPHLPQFKSPESFSRRGVVVSINISAQPLELDILPPAADHLR